MDSSTVAAAAAVTLSRAGEKHTMTTEHGTVAAGLPSASSSVVDANSAASPSSFSSSSTPPPLPPVAFHVTGFGVFNGVPDNPTTHLVRELPGELKARGYIRSRGGIGGGDTADSSSCASAGPQPGALAAHDGCFEVNSHVVLDVSAQEGGQQVREMHARLSRRRRKKGSGSVSVSVSTSKDAAVYPIRRPLYEGTVGNGDGAAYRTSGNDHNPEQHCSDIIEGCSGSAAVAGISSSAVGAAGEPGRFDPEEEEDRRQQSVFVHCGVDGGAKTFKLESRGYNEATFRVPDEKGYSPSGAPIDESNPDIAHVRETTLPIADILGKLDRIGWGPDRVQESTSAGRFVCNYVYYTSLGLCEEASLASAECGLLPNNCRRHSLFLHVPPFSVIAKEEQLSFVIDCLATIAECLGAAAASDPEEDHVRGTSAAVTTGVFGSAPANMVMPISPDDHQPVHPMPLHLMKSPCHPYAPPQDPPSPAVPSRSNAGLPRAHVGLARSHSMPYHGCGRSAVPLAGDTTSMIWDDDGDFRRVKEKRASLPLPLLGEDEGLRSLRFRSSPGAAMIRHAEYGSSSSNSSSGNGNRREYSSRRSHHYHDVVHDYEGEEDEQETPAEVTKWRLVEAGFEELDVDAAMATTGSDDMETNMQLLLDITPLLPRGSPAVGDVNALREFLNSSNDHATRRRVGGGGAAPRHSSAGNRIRTRSVGSSIGMGGVSPKWAGDIVPKVMPTNGGTPSPAVSSNMSTPRGRGGLLSRFRRHKKGSSSGGSSSTTTATASPSPAKIPQLSSSSSGGGSEAASTSTTTTARPTAGAMKERPAPARPIVARSSSATSWAATHTASTIPGGGGGGVPSPEYCRRTTGNSQSQSPPPDQLRGAVGSGIRPKKIDPSAGWGDPSSLVGATLRLVLLVRLDIGMGPGAIAAHCCRAALAVTRKAEGGGRADALAVWRDAGEATVVLAVRDSRALSAVLEVAATSNLPITMVRDKGAVGAQEDSCTVAALGPSPVSALHAVAGGMPVL